MAAVFLGSMQTPAGERRVAIKRLLAERELDADDNDRFIAEAKLVFRLTHANICQVIDLGVNDEGTFILMEYVEGLDLRALLRKLRESGRRLDVASAVHAVREIAKALDYAHRRNDDDGHPLQLVHGDVTPQNVLISVEGEVKLADFGIASATRAHAPGNSLRGGTPGFMAPEVMDGANDHRSDIYSLGVTLFVALGGRVHKDKPLDISALAAARPEVGELARIVERATALHAEDRFLSAGELEQALAFHLARRYPEFTPSLLASVVRSCGTRVTEPASDERVNTLVSIVHAPRAAIARHEHNSTHTIEETPRPHTAPLPVRRSSKPTVALFVIGVLGVVATGFAFYRGAHAPTIPVVDTPRRQPVELPAPPVVNTVPRPPVVAPTPPAVTTAKAHAHKNSDAHRETHRVSEAPVEGNGWLTVSAEPWGAILLDGKRIADQTPLYRYALAAGPHTVVVVDPETGRRAPARRVVVRAGEAQVVGFRW